MKIPEMTALTVSIHAPVKGRLLDIDQDIG